MKAGLCPNDKSCDRVVGLESSSSETFPNEIFTLHARPASRADP